jgi:sn-glycerol 3-phosphate transport system substrate-binding protein
MKRRSLLLGAAASGLVGCGRSLPPEAKGRTVATLWFSYGGKNREVLLDLVKQYNQKQARDFILPTYQGDYFEALAKLRTALAANAAPTFTHVVGEVVPYLAEANVLEPLDRGGYEGADELDLVPALSQAGGYTGTGAESAPLYCIPFNRSTPIMYANGKLLDEAGVAIPRTWEELREAARKLTHREGERTTRFGFEVPVNWWFWVAMVGQSGGSLVDPQGRVTLGAEGGERALAFWQRLVHEDKSMRPPPGRDYNAWQATNQDFLAGRAALIWTSTAFLRYLEENAKFPVVAAKLPFDRQPACPTGGTHFVVVRKAPTEEKQAAWRFLRWMVEADQTIAWANRTGYLPVTNAALQRLSESGYYAAHPNDRVAVDQLAEAMPWPWSTSLFRIQRDVVEPRLEGAVLGNRPAHEAMEEARAAARRS